MGSKVTQGEIWPCGDRKVPSKMAKKDLQKPKPNTSPNPDPNPNPNPNLVGLWS